MGAPDDRYEAQRLANLRPPAWRNPTPAGPYHLVVLGAGPAGVAAARAAAALGARVALVERDLLGGRCLNSACIPSKSLVRTARLLGDIRAARRFGLAAPAELAPDFATVMARMRAIRAHLSIGDALPALVAAGIDVFHGAGVFDGPDALRVDGQRLVFAKAVIATGARPDVAEVPGLAEAGYLTDDDIFDLTCLPPRLAVIGGGPLGCELAQVFCRLGSRVTIVQSRPLFLGGEERDAAQILAEAFIRDGINVRLNTTAVAVRRVAGQILVDLVSDDYRNTLEVDAILTGAGRLPNVEGLGLDAAGVAYDAGGIAVDDFLCTGNPNIYAAGDVCLEHKFSHTAREAAQMVVHNALCGGRARLSRLVIPWCTFTDPEIAHVGLHVREANRLGIPIKTFTVPMHQVARAVTDSEEEGFVKVHVREGTDRILGATIIARHAGEMINELTLAMVAGIGLRELARVLHSFPTQAQAIRMAALAYRTTRLTPRVLARLARRLPSLPTAKEAP